MSSRIISQTLRNDSLLTWQTAAAFCWRYPAPAWPAERRGLLFALNTLYQQHNKADTDAPRIIGIPILETISIPNAVVVPRQSQESWSTFHITCRREYDAPALCFGDFQVDPARYTTRRMLVIKQGIAVTPPISIKYREYPQSRR